MIQKLKSFLLKFLIFIRLVDSHDQSLSVTNIAMYIVLFKLATSQQASAVDLGSMFLAMSNYGLKKYINKDSINTASKIANQLITKSDTLASDN